MEAGVCPFCGAPYAAADLAGLGILRARPAVAGGPTLEYRCGACGRVIVLVPHGEGRYARPGEPPPPPVPPEHRRPAWADPSKRRAASPPPTPRPEPSAGPPPAARTAPGPAAHAPAPPPVPDARPVGPHEALELLGVPPTATRAEVESAFRARSLTCHPDKVAHLDPDFQALAHRKFQRLVEAFRLLTE